MVALFATSLFVCSAGWEDVFERVLFRGIFFYSADVCAFFPCCNLHKKKLVRLQLGGHLQPSLAQYDWLYRLSTVVPVDNFAQQGRGFFWVS